MVVKIAVCNGLTQDFVTEVACWQDREARTRNSSHPFGFISEFHLHCSTGVSESVFGQLSTSRCSKLI